jgi:plastocyanin
MKRLVGVLLVALAIVAVPAMAGAGQGEGKTMNAQGTVSAVSPDSLTVKGKTDTWTFTIDKTTSVTAKGATHKSLALKADGKATVLTDFVKNGDTVNVAYHDMGTMKHAATITVTISAAK